MTYFEEIMTLQELCLDTICDSLDRFCYAYCTTDSDDLRLRFQFLQKFYSSRLASSLEYEDLLPDTCPDLIFSKYLTSVDTVWFLSFSWKAIFDIFAKIGPNLENVFFNKESEMIEDDAMFYVEEDDDFESLENICCDDKSKYMLWRNVICYLPNVKTITYPKFCNDGALECIAKYCPKLETLDVKNSSSVTDYGLKYFYQKEQGKVPCPLLKEIFLESILINSDSIEHLLKNLPLLEQIDYPDLPYVLYTMHKNELGSLDKVERYNLKHLNLLKNVHLYQRECYDDILQICFTVCPKLKSFYCPLFKLEHSVLCSMLPSVEDLNLDCVNSTSVEVNDVLKKNGGRLTSLTLRNCSVSLSVLVQCCPRLNQLTMNVADIQYNDDNSIPMFCNLKALTIQNVDLSNPGYYKAICHILISSPILESLYLKKYNSFSSGMKAEILKCCVQCALKLLDFSGSDVEAEFVKDILLTCSTLKTLNLDASFMEKMDLYEIASTLPNTPELFFTDEFGEKGNLNDSMELSDSDYYNFNDSMELSDSDYYNFNNSMELSDSDY